jgi:hypothetical protein
MLTDNAETLLELFNRRNEGQAPVGARSYAAREKIVVKVSGDPRGYCLRLYHSAIPGNTWGGQESGFGVGS